MIRTIIIDDEPLAADMLALLLQKKFGNIAEVIAVSNSPAEGIQLIKQLSPDLVFLDIQMPGINGLDLLRHFIHPDFRVVFVTAFDNYAVDAFRLSAIDYLLKPVEESEIVRVFDKIKTETDRSQNPISEKLRHLETLLAQNQTVNEPRIGIALADKISFVNPRDILYCESNGSYTHLYFTDGKKIVTSKPLHEFEEQLFPLKFFRIHHSFLINLERLKEFQRHDGGFVIMENGVKLEVSQRRRKEFMEAIHHIVI